ncbi:MAG: parallel beta-helix domain-containing protein [Bacteroidota bacterium]
MNITSLLSSIFALLLLAACSGTAQKADSKFAHQLSFGPGEEDAIRTALISLKDNTEITLKAGTYSFEKLSIQGKLKNISIKGAGPEQTIIDFAGQESGGEGMRVDDVYDFEIADLQLKESAGDLLKVKDSEKVRFINVHTVWAGEPEITNGGYGIYPVLCKDVLIDGCYARGASDAGIYVGQTLGAVVRNSKVEYCVAGIEIENTQDAEVYGNVANNNTGGLLVFDHPGLKYHGKNIKVYDNHVFSNNYRNFAPAANSATGVGNLPPGTGIMVLRTSDVEVYNNKLEDNNTMSVGILSYISVDPNIMKNAPDFDPIPRNIYFHNNQISKQDEFPEAVKEHELASILVGLHGELKKSGMYEAASLPHILYDGISLAEGDNPNNICIQEAEGTGFLNMDMGNQSQNLSFDPAPFNCDGKTKA